MFRIETISQIYSLVVRNISLVQLCHTKYMVIFIFVALSGYKNILTTKISRFTIPYFLIVEPLRVFCLLQYHKNAGETLFGSCAKIDMLVFFALEL